MTMVEATQEGEGEMEREELEASPSFFIENLLEQGSGENNEMSENTHSETDEKLMEEIIARFNSVSELAII